MQGQDFLGILGVINAITRVDPNEPVITAVYDNGELTGFVLQDDESPAVDMRVVPSDSMTPSYSYRVYDRAGNAWEGMFTGYGEPTNQAIHLQLADGSIARVFFHDVAKVITA